MAHLSRQPPRGHRRDRLLHGPHRHVPRALRLLLRPPRSAPAAALPCHHPSDGGLDHAATPPGVPLRPGTALPDPRPRRQVRQRGPHRDPPHEYQSRSRLAVPGRTESPSGSSAPHAAISWTTSSSSTKSTCSAFWPVSPRTTSTTGRTCPWRRTRPRCESSSRSRIQPPRSSLCLASAGFTIATLGAAPPDASARQVHRRGLVVEGVCPCREAHHRHRCQPPPMTVADERGVRSARVFACHSEPREPSRVPGLDCGEGQPRKGASPVSLRRVGGEKHVPRGKRVGAKRGLKEIAGLLHPARLVDDPGQTYAPPPVLPCAFAETRAIPHIHLSVYR